MCARENTGVHTDQVPKKMNYRIANRYSLEIMTDRFETAIENEMDFVHSGNKEII
jgi:hypothetical protein